MQVLVGGIPANGDRFDRRMAVPAVDAVVADVVEMAELNRLFDELFSACHIRGPAKDDEKTDAPAGQKKTTDNTDSRDGIGATDGRSAALNDDRVARLVGAAITPPDGHKSAGISPVNRSICTML